MIIQNNIKELEKERTELLLKINTLKKFISLSVEFNYISAYHQQLLRDQYTTMVQYWDIISRRIRYIIYHNKAVKDSLNND